MNIKVFKALLVHMKQKYRCVKCKKRLADKELSLKDLDTKIVTLESNCTRCKTQSVFEVQLLDNSTREHKAIAKKKVSTNDILDVKNFLKDFQGSFKDLFKQQ